jgi:hypothetical protein
MYVTVAMEVLKDHGKQIARVYPKELRRLFQKGVKALLLGRLNIDFQPYRQRTAASRVDWLVPACKRTKFYGLEVVRGLQQPGRSKLC